MLRAVKSLDGYDPQSAKAFLSSDAVNRLIGKILYDGLPADRCPKQHHQQFAHHRSHPAANRSRDEKRPLYRLVVLNHTYKLVFLATLAIVPRHSKGTGLYFVRKLYFTPVITPVVRKVRYMSDGSTFRVNNFLYSELF